MNKHVMRYFAIAIVFLGVAIVFFSKANISVGHFILIFFCGATFGANLINGVNSIKKKNQET
jgi:hypothetical protein